MIAATTCMRKYGWVMLLTTLLAGDGRAQNHPPVLKEVQLPSKVATGTEYTFRVRYSDADGDPASSIACLIEGPGGTQRKEFTFPPDADWKNGVDAEFKMGPFTPGSYTVVFETESAGAVSKTTPQRIVAETAWAIWVKLAFGLLVALLFLPLIVFLLARSIAPNADPTRSARLGLLAGIVLSYVWFAYLFSDLNNPVLLVIGGIVALGGMVALLGGKKRAQQS